MSKTKISSETVVSISAIVIAIVSVIITVWQGIETRRHNRLSVQPRLDISYELNYTDSLAQLKIINNGLGPAIIDLANVNFNNTDYIISQTNGYFEFLKSYGLEGISISYELLDEGSTIVPNDTKTIFSLNTSDLDKKGVDPRSIFSDCLITVYYKSLYEEEFAVENK